MQIPLYQIDAFSHGPFSGAPNAVCPLPNWLDDRTMQAIAAENNLPDTAFIVRNGDDYDIRWFTPAIEVDLCGTATLASGLVVLQILEPGRALVTFNSKSGPLTVAKSGEMLALDFPSRQGTPSKMPAALVRAMNKHPKEVLFAVEDYMAVFESEDDIRDLQPDFSLLSEIGGRGLIVTALGTQSDFVSRFFAPNSGILEDPVTGSAHCMMVPYWGKRLKKTQLHALQISPRGGELFCEDRGERVTLAGRAALFLEGTIRL